MYVCEIIFHLFNLILVDVHDSNSHTYAEISLFDQKNPKLNFDGTTRRHKHCEPPT
jgi:hypothetical protein